MLLPYDEPWQTLVGSLALFSDDFMAEHEQLATRERESARMNRLLDTNICIFLIRRRPAALIRRLTSFRAGELALSSITVAELRFGVEKSRDLARDQGAPEQFLLPFAVVDFDRAAAVAYGRMRADLEGKGTPLGALDTLIAAHALRLHVRLATNNTREFARVPGLKLEDWAQGTAAEEAGS